MLERIQKENDIKKLNSEELECLAGEIREFLVEKVSKTGGHLASNLGVVELTMALHLICDLPKDKIIWDVGHQSYTHKLLTGRKEGFEDLRSYGGMRIWELLIWDRFRDTIYQCSAKLLRKRRKWKARYSFML